MKRWSLIHGIAPLLLLAFVGAPGVAAANDYPTAARVDYVLGCMAANGQNQLVMQKCACSIDVIAELMPYEDYEEAETILSMRERRGELGVLFRTERGMEDRMQEFRRAQAEADLRCF
ncbi:hypothetical protein [Aquisalimonas asiatica]|uniref:Uncharacterized protein n=1 Tax=Aquisalimonas asiatica TaxID=406100 RepID=A0A1H8UFT6_9GAMM|nr:hypothetical protein [Aquisalimonas asiatica]SEP02112.1 hypothetical protein SAMN04488052_106182 [Aquisalimonas asiatica]